MKRSIAADPGVIWGPLTDASAYPDWNPAVLGIEGSITEGERIRLTSIVKPDRVFKLNVSDVNAPRSMVWSDGMPLGLFKGARTFSLTPQDDGTTEFSMEEVYTGVSLGHGRATRGPSKVGNGQASTVRYPVPMS